MKGATTTVSVNGGPKVPFNLEPSHGTIPPRVVEELVSARTYAKDASEAFGDAIKAQAAKYQLKPAALRKYVAALEADKLDEAKVETEQLADLIG